MSTVPVMLPPPPVGEALEWSFAIARPGAEDGLGVLFLTSPGAVRMYALSPDDLERFGEQAVETARRIRSGLVIASSVVVEDDRLGGNGNGSG